MTRKFYHGTSADNLQSILINGLSTDEIKLWNCSNDEIYLWCPLGVCDAECLEDEEPDMWHESAFKMANESAQIACAVAKDCRAIVLVIELDDSEVSPDYSCDNMESKGAVVCGRNILPSEIKEIHISDDLSMIKGYLINMLVNNEYNGCEFTRQELAIARCFDGNYDIVDYIDEIVQYTPYMESV